jgi:hypothetical protein
VRAATLFYARQRTAASQDRDPRDMTTTDPITSALELPEPIFGRAFKPLPSAVTAGDVHSEQRFFESLVRMLHSHEGRRQGNGVAVWALDQPYAHQDGKESHSGVLYIEKYSGSLAYRWPRRYLRYLATDEGHGGEPQNRNCLRELAHLDHNWSFYSSVVRVFGPLRIWRATVDELNVDGNRTFASAREWELHFNTTYMDAYGCLPLKNRRL